MAQFSTAEVAAKFDTTPRTLRKFLRSDAKAKDAATPGKGSRYAIEGRDLAAMKKRFKTWSEAEVKAKEAKVKDTAPIAPEVEVEVEEDFDNIEGPTAEDLADIED